MGGRAAVTTNTTAGREAAGRARGWCGVLLRGYYIIQVVENVSLWV